MKHYLLMLSGLCCWFSTCVRSEVKDGLSCAEARRAFRRQMFTSKIVFPDHAQVQRLSICPSDGPTCCNYQTEGRFSHLARKDMSAMIDDKFSSLNQFFVNFLRKYENQFISLIQKTKTGIYELIMQKLPNTARVKVVDSIVTSFFDDITIAKNENTFLQIKHDTPHFIQRFGDAVFALKFGEETYNELNTQDLQCISGQAAISPHYKRILKELSKHLIDALNQTAMFTQAVQSAVDALRVRSADFMSAECRNALVQMKYCAHCQLLTEAKPCRNYCLNVVSGCLVGVAEINRYWFHYVTSLIKLSNRIMERHNDVESFLIRFKEQVQRLLDLAIERNVVQSISRSCNLPHYRTRHRRSSGTPGLKKKKKRHSKVNRRNELREEETLKLKSLLESFVQFLDCHTNFFDSLPEKICDSQQYLSVDDNCWNGNTVVNSYLNPVAFNEYEAQLNNPEVRINGFNPVVQKSAESLRISTKVLKLGVDDPIPLLLQHAASYVTSVNNQSDPSDRIFGDPCGDDEDGCTETGSGDNDVFTGYDANSPMHLAPQKPTLVENSNSRPNERQIIEINSLQETSIPLSEITVTTESNANIFDKWVGVDSKTDTQTTPQANSTPKLSTKKLWLFFVQLFIVLISYIFS